MKINLVRMKTLAERVGLVCDMLPQNWHDPERTGVMEGYLRSLGATLGAVLQGRNPGSYPSPGFTCTNDDGRVHLRFRGTTVPVKSIHVRTFFFANRMALESGESMILDAGVARTLMHRELDSCDTEMERIFHEAGRYDIPIDGETGVLGPFVHEIAEIRSRKHRLREFIAAAHLMDQRRRRLADSSPPTVRRTA